MDSKKGLPSLLAPLKGKDLAFSHGSDMLDMVIHVNNTHPVRTSFNSEPYTGSHNDRR